MGPAYLPAHGAAGCSLRRCVASGHARLVRTNSATASPGRIVLAAERLQQRPVAASAPSEPSPASSASATAAVATPPPGAQPALPAVSAVAPAQPLKPASRSVAQPVFVPVPEDVLEEFEHKLEADLQTVGVTLTAILGVIIFWRGVWSLLDHFIGDSVLGDVACIIAGLTIILYIRLTGMKIASFWPPS